MLTDPIKELMDALTGYVIQGTIKKWCLSGYRAGLRTADMDLGGDGDGRKVPLDIDADAIDSIGLRTHALSESTIAQAKGSLAFEADKLQLELNAKLKAGMNEREALGQLKGRIEELFERSFEGWKLDRLVRDQFLVATKEGRRAGWQKGGIQWRQWQMHSDSHTADDSKRMNGQIVRIDEPYTDWKTGEKYMLPHMRPNDRRMDGLNFWSKEHSDCCCGYVWHIRTRLWIPRNGICPFRIECRELSYSFYCLSYHWGDWRWTCLYALAHVHRRNGSGR